MEDELMMMDGNMSMGPCDSMSGMNMSMGGMAMVFTFSGHQCSFLFPNLNLDTPTAMFGAIVLIILVAILYEGLKSLREFLASLETQPSTSKETKAASQQPSQRGRDDSASKEGSVSLSNNVQSPSHIISPERTPLIHTKPRQLNVLKLAMSSWLRPLHLLQSVLHAVQVGVAYILMLVAMTYNGWLFLSVCVGAGLGYFIFARCTRSINAIRSKQDHCHN